MGDIGDRRLSIPYSFGRLASRWLRQGKEAQRKSLVLQYQDLLLNEWLRENRKAVEQVSDLWLV